jgi:hypothetical protein
MSEFNIDWSNFSLEEMVKLTAPAPSVTSAPAVPSPIVADGSVATLLGNHSGLPESGLRLSSEFDLGDLSKFPPNFFEELDAASAANPGLYAFEFSGQ